MVYEFYRNTGSTVDRKWGISRSTDPSTWWAQRLHIYLLLRQYLSHSLSPSSLFLLPLPSSSFSAPAPPGLLFGAHRRAPAPPPHAPRPTPRGPLLLRARAIGPLLLHLTPMGRRALAPRSSQTGPCSSDSRCQATSPPPAPGTSPRGCCPVHI